jgi:hypothetical protein
MGAEACSDVLQRTHEHPAPVQSDRMTSKINAFAVAHCKRFTLRRDAQRQRQKALARWDGEGGAGPEGLQEGKLTSMKT